MSHIEINNQTKFKINKIAIERFLRQIISRSKKIFDLSVAFVDWRTMQHLNSTYRHRNQPTDVLSFEDLNEIIICYEVAHKQAKLLNHSTDQEIKNLLIHGVLHLIGFNHQTVLQKNKMDRAATKLLKN
jgi:probable rRNA maturation factor